MAQKTIEDTTSMSKLNTFHSFGYKFDLLGLGLDSADAAFLIPLLLIVVAILSRQIVDSQEVSVFLGLFALTAVLLSLPASTLLDKVDTVLEINNVKEYCKQIEANISKLEYSEEEKVRNFVSTLLQCLIDTQEDTTYIVQILKILSTCMKNSQNVMELSIALKRTIQQYCESNTLDAKESGLIEMLENIF